LTHKKYPEVLWSVRPEKVTAMGIANQERSEKAVAKKPINIKLRAFIIIEISK
jgi:hypothetical protein